MTGVTLCDGNYFVTGVLAPNKPVQFNSPDSGHWLRRTFQTHSGNLMSVRLFVSGANFLRFMKMR